MFRADLTCRRGGFFVKSSTGLPRRFGASAAGPSGAAAAGARVGPAGPGTEQAGDAEDAKVGAAAELEVLACLRLSLYEIEIIAFVNV